MTKMLSLFLAVIVFGGSVYAQTCPTNIKRTAPNSRYTLQTGGAEVLDKQTDLIWQRCSVGQSWDGNTCAGAAVGHTWQQALQVAKDAGVGWTLPNIRELQSLVERGCYDPAANETFFPNTPSDWYWSSSPVLLSNSEAWTMSFYNGLNLGMDGWMGRHSYVRLVRSNK